MVWRTNELTLYSTSCIHKTLWLEKIYGTQNGMYIFSDIHKWTPCYLHTQYGIIRLEAVFSVTCILLESDLRKGFDLGRAYSRMSYCISSTLIQELKIRPLGAWGSELTGLHGSLLRSFICALPNPFHTLYSCKYRAVVNQFLTFLTKTIVTVFYLPYFGENVKCRIHSEKKSLRKFFAKFYLR